ncbi:MAG TPA: MBL fold metallo-hydrolase [Bacteroidetes bacterium]|nr:MBL fold metallo-hydrolase [Bacteroidota bacterium]
MITIIDLEFLGHQNTIGSFLIETLDGPLLIETGPHSTLPVLEAGIEKAGYKLKDIRHVFLSHIHLDHAGAAWVFAQHGATVYLHPLGQRHMADPSRLLASAKMIYKEDMDRLWGTLKPIPADQLRVVKDGETVQVGDVGLRGVYTPGHAVHHIAWAMGKTLFTGDVAGVKIGSGIVVPPCPPPDINVEDWVASIGLIKKGGFEELYLTHFGKVTNVSEHLQELETRLHDWANWMKPYWEKGADPKEVTPLFQTYVQQQLIAGGIEGEDLARYEGANPSWMSVAGLMRYWRKKEG